MGSFDLAKSDLYNTVKRATDLGGQIFYDIIPTGTANATATGTAAAEVDIASSYAVPSAAKEILAISPALAPTAEAAADVKMAWVELRGANYKAQPFQVPCPVGSVVLSVGAARSTPREWWAVRYPVTVGDTYQVSVNTLVANAHNMKAQVAVMYSTVRTGLRPIYSQMQSAATGFKAAGSNSTGSITLQSASEILEMFTLTSPEAAAVAQENQILSHIASCTAFRPVQTIAYPDEIPATIASTSGDCQMMQIARHLTPGTKLSASNPTINYTTILDVATSNNINVAHGVRYI